MGLHLSTGSVIWNCGSSPCPTMDWLPQNRNLWFINVPSFKLIGSWTIVHYFVPLWIDWWFATVISLHCMSVLDASPSPARYYCCMHISRKLQMSRTYSLHVGSAMELFIFLYLIKWCYAPIHKCFSSKTFVYSFVFTTRNRRRGNVTKTWPACMADTRK